MKFIRDIINEKKRLDSEGRSAIPSQVVPDAQDEILTSTADAEDIDLPGFNLFSDDEDPMVGETSAGADEETVADVSAEDAEGAPLVLDEPVSVPATASAPSSEPAPEEAGTSPLLDDVDLDDLGGLLNGGEQKDPLEDPPADLPQAVLERAESQGALAGDTSVPEQPRPDLAPEREVKAPDVDREPAADAPPPVASASGRCPSFAARPPIPQPPKADPGRTPTMAQSLAAPHPAKAPSASQVPPQPQAAAEISQTRQTPSSAVEVPSPAAGRGSRRAGRVKTRLLGFNTAQNEVRDPFAAKGAQVAPFEAAQPEPVAPEPAATEQSRQFPVGWLVVVSGPGRGASFTLFAGVAQIGRGASQSVRLDFGDNSISRENHAAIAYDPEQRRFFLGHGGKANLVRLNDQPVLSTEELQSGHLIRLGETTLRFIGFCGTQFDWDAAPASDLRHASFG